MKKLLLPIALCLSMLASASVPQTITYQAVVRNNVHKLVRAKAVGVRISILKGSETGSVVYSENRKATTNINGLLTFAIGDEEAVTGDDLSKINWGDGVYFIKCEMDPNGGTNYTLESTSQLMSVPYAIYAERISKDATPAWTQTPEKPVYTYSEIEGAPEIKDITEQDPEYKKSVAAGISAKDTARWNKKMDSFSETDPAFAKSAAATITQADIDKWNSTPENVSQTVTDPAFAQSVAAGITKEDTARWNKTANLPATIITNVDIDNWNKKLDNFTETDPTFAKSIASTITKEDIDNWNSKMSSYSESDPEYKKSLAAGITAADTARWNKVEKLGNQPANNITNVDINNWNNKLDSYTETDPAFAASVAAGITKADTARWNKFEKNVAANITETQINIWNNKLDSYSETDPFFRSSVASGISKADTARWNKSQKIPANTITKDDIANWNKKLSEESDPTFAKSDAARITATDIEKWNGKLDAETDPTFAKSAASKITTEDVAKWNAKMDSYTETDPAFAKSEAAKITAADVAKWNNKLDSYAETDPIFTVSEAAKIKASDIANWNAKLSEESDPKFSASEAAKITAADMTKWNSKLDEESDPTFISSVAAGITKADTANWNKVLKIEKQPANAITQTDINNWNNKLDSYTETDPEYSKSLAAKISAKDTTRWGRFSKSPAATITETDIEYWNDIINQIPENVSSFTNDAHYVTQNQLNINNNTMYNMMFAMEKYYEDSLMAVSKNYADSIRTVQQEEMTTYQQSVTNQFNTVNNKVTNMPASGISATDITNWNGKLSVELDPEFKKSAAAGITATDIDNWNAKLGSFTENDPAFNQSSAARITATDITNWNNKLDAYTETDPLFAESEAAKITKADVTNWNNKLDSYTETDPIFTVSEAAKITATDVANWNNKLDAYTETDPVYTASVAANIKASDTLRWSKKLNANDVADWAKAENKPAYDYTEITNTPSKVSAFENDKNYITDADLALYDQQLMVKALAMEKHYEDSLKAVAKARIKVYTDSVIAAENAKLNTYKIALAAQFNNINRTITNMPASAITTDNISDWNNKLDSEIDPVFEASEAAKIKATDVANWNNKLNSDEISDWAKEPAKPTYNYNEIEEAPTKVSKFENDAKYIKESELDEKLKAITDLLGTYKKTIDSLKDELSTIKQNILSEGELPGMFSIGENVKVRFAQGNLQYNPSTGAMQFADKQYTVIGDESRNIVNKTYDGWCDLLRRDEYLKLGTIAIDNGGDNPTAWRMLKESEFIYLYNDRTNASNLRTKATVNGVKGLVLLADKFKKPTSVTMTIDAEDFFENNYTEQEWECLEKAGAIFLPSAGLTNKDGNVESLGDIGYYWLDSEFQSMRGQTTILKNKAIHFGGSIVLPAKEITIKEEDLYLKKIINPGFSIRLVQVKQ